MVKVTSTGELTRLLSVPLILPVPLAGIPVTLIVLSLVQLNTVPGTVPVITTGVIAKLLQIVCEVGNAVALGVGLTVMVKVTGVPTQLTPLVNVGVTVMVAVTGAVVALVAVKVGILPVPLAPRPIDVLLLVQLNTTVPPVVGLLKLTGALPDPLHTTWFGTVFTTAVGLTVIVKLRGVPIHVTPALV